MPDIERQPKDVAYRPHRAEEDAEEKIAGQRPQIVFHVSGDTVQPGRRKDALKPPPSADQNVFQYSERVLVM